jgi:Protein of unknown function (DUF3309)
MTVVIGKVFEDAIVVLSDTMISGPKLTLLIIVVLLLIGALPAWPYSAAWGPAPAGILGVILIVVLILVLLGRI